MTFDKQVILKENSDNLDLRVRITVQTTVYGLGIGLRVTASLARPIRVRLASTGGLPLDCHAFL